MVRRIPLDETSPQALVGATLALLSGRTRLLAVSHVTTDWGVRLPVAQICAAVEARGVPTFVDTAHSAGVLPVDLHAIGCSYAGVLSYKWMLAPYAAGAFYVRADRLPSLPVVFAGGRAEAILDMAAGTMELYEDARRFEYGPWSWPLVHAWAAALDYVEAIGLDAIERRTAALTNRMKAGLAAIPGVTLHTPRSDREFGGARRLRRRRLAGPRTRVGAAGSVRHPRARAGEHAGRGPCEHARSSRSNRRWTV